MRCATRVRLFGGDDLAAAATTLGLEVTENAPQLAIVDLRDERARSAAAALGDDVPRILIAGEVARSLLAASGIAPGRIASSCAAHVLGPLITAALPQPARGATRTVVVSAMRGGTGRTLLVANVARRLAPKRSVCAIDLTGTGALAWWLGVAARPWSELEALHDELSADHLALLATEAAPRLRVIGGPAAAPTIAVASATLRGALAMDDLVIVDAPLVADALFRAAARAAERMIVLSYEDPASVAAVNGALPDGAWLVASQSRSERVDGREVFRALPRDERAVAEAMATRALVGGALGRAYDDLADVLLLDAS